MQTERMYRLYRTRVWVGSSMTCEHVENKGIQYSIIYNYYSTSYKSSSNWCVFLMVPLHPRNLPAKSTGQTVGALAPQSPINGSNSNSERNIVSRRFIQQVGQYIPKMTWWSMVIWLDVLQWAGLIQKLMCWYHRPQEGLHHMAK